MQSVESDIGRVQAVMVEADSDDLGDLLKSERDALALELVPSFRADGDSQQPSEA